MATYQTIRDILLKVKHQEEWRWGLLGRWTVLGNDFHNDNVLLVTVALAKGLLKYDGGNGLRLTRRGRRVLGPYPYR